MQVPRLNPITYSAPEGMEVQYLTELILANPEPAAGLFDITPAFANALLDRNEGNRDPKQVNQAHIASDMREGEWYLNGATIIVSTEGRVLDGGHRLRGVSESGKSIRSFLVLGINPKAQASIDLGTTRGIKDRLHFAQGIDKDDANVIGVSTGWLMQWERYGKVSQTGTNRPSQVAIQKRVPQLMDLLNEAMDVVPRERMPLISRQACVAFYMMAKKSGNSRDDLQRYINQLLHGEGLSTGEPTLVARERLILNKTRSKGRLTPPEVLELMARVWNAIVENRDIAKVQIMGKMPDILHR